MEYVKLGDNEVSRLGFGCMRFPEKDGDIDYEKAMEMVDYAISKGVNYFDTAYVYHGGNSEKFISKVIEKHGRENLFIADKLPMWNCVEEEDMQKYLDEELKRLGTDYIDYFLFHSLSLKTFNFMKKNNYWKFIAKNKANGKIRHIGFSFHDSLDVFKEIIDDYDWEFCQIQFNYIDTEYQAGLDGYNYATSKGIPVIVMEPIRGGSLSNTPSSVRKIFSDSALKDYKDAEIALKYVANFENNKVILSGMNKLSDVEANIKLFENPLVNTLSNDELKKYEEAREKFFSFTLINCTGCDYCKTECPGNIPISDIFKKYNSDIEKPDFSNREWYKNQKINGEHCIKCGGCEVICPQKINIIENLEKIHKQW